MTIKFCKSHGSSNGVRNFIETDMVDFARRNPGIAMYLKPRRHRSPVVVAEYLNGERHWMSLQNCEMEEVAKWLEVLSTSASEGNIRYKAFQHTDNPSVQGVWTPFTYKTPDHNIMEFPNAQFRDPENTLPTASDVVLKRYGKVVQPGKMQ
jgi:large subunit ribosomal protein L43